MKRSSSTTSKHGASESEHGSSVKKRSRARGALRKAGMALGLAAVVWAVSRRGRGGNGMPDTDEVRERATEAMPDAVAQRVGGGGQSDEMESDWSEGSSRGATSDTSVGSTPGSEEFRSDETSRVDQSMSEGEMEERVESDARDEPAPPGEMNVDEEVTDEVFGGGDDSSTENEEDMLGQDETDMESDEDEEE